MVVKLVAPGARFSTVLSEPSPQAMVTTVASVGSGSAMLPERVNFVPSTSPVGSTSAPSTGAAFCTGKLVVTLAALAPSSSLPVAVTVRLAALLA